jgi:7,8-dihydropterin-6-yl-methyl-4-(beta-D-ribofuranosyl)aminobenzene 5'-phosphate synthase
MNITIVCDHTTTNKKLHQCYGFACYIGTSVVFDTSESGDYLLNNMRAMNISIQDIEALVISHDHWDHTGGSYMVLEKRKGLCVYGCPHFTKEYVERVNNLGGNYKGLREVTEIRQDIFATGEIPGTYKGGPMPEQALLVRTGNGITVITGCAHPGIVTILNQVKKIFPGETIYAALGGFHLVDKNAQQIRHVAEEVRALGVKKIGPAHCSGRLAEDIFHEMYGDNFLTIKSGQVLTV